MKVSKYLLLFQVFSDSLNLQYIKQYIANSLLETKYEKQSIDFDFSDEITQELNKLIPIEFLEYNLKSIFYICEMLYEISDFNQFILFLSKYLSSLITSEEDDFIKSEDDVFDDDNEETPTNHIENLLTLLDDKIGGRKKND